MSKAYSLGDVYNLLLLDNKSKEVAAVAFLITQRAIPEMTIAAPASINCMNMLKEIANDNKNDI